jgi:hypothetical protein
MDYFIRKGEFYDRVGGFKSALNSENSTEKIRSHTTFEYDISTNRNTGFSARTETVGYVGGGANSNGRAYSVGHADSVEYDDELAEKQIRQAEGVKILYQAPITVSANGGETRPSAVAAAQTNAAAGDFGQGYTGGVAQNSVGDFRSQNATEKTANAPKPNVGDQIGAPQKSRPEFYVDFALRNKANAKTTTVDFGGGATYGVNHSAQTANGSAYGANIANANTYGANNSAQTANGSAYGVNNAANGATYGANAANANTYGVNNAPTISNSDAKVSRLPLNATLEERLVYGSGSSNLAPDFFENSISTVRSDFDRRQELDKLYHTHAEKVESGSYEEMAKVISRVVKDNRNGEILQSEIGGIDPRFEGASRSVLDDGESRAEDGFDRYADAMDLAAEEVGAGSIRVVNPSRTRTAKQIVKRVEYDLDDDFNGGYDGEKAAKKGKFFKSPFKKKDASGRDTGLTGLGKFVVGVYAAVATALAVFIISNLP